MSEAETLFAALRQSAGDDVVRPNQSAVAARAQAHLVIAVLSVYVPA